MAFCKAIAIYREPIYLQFASGREGAADGGRASWGGRGLWGGFGCLLAANTSLSRSSSAAEGDGLLSRQALLAQFVPSGSAAARAACAGARRGVPGGEDRGLCAGVRAAGAACQVFPRCPALVSVFPAKPRMEVTNSALRRGAGDAAGTVLLRSALILRGPCDGSGFARFPSPPLSDVAPPRD